MSRNTVKRALREDKIGHKYQRDKQPTPKLGDYKAQLETWLIEERIFQNLNVGAAGMRWFRLSRQFFRSV